MVSPIGHVSSVNEIRSLLNRAGAIVGGPELAALVAAHRSGSPPVRHRLADQLIRLDDAIDGRLSPIAQDAALVSMPEVDSVLTFAEQWRNSAAWPEVRRGLRSAAEYLHSVGVLAVGSALSVHHPATEPVVATANGRGPDLILVVPGTPPLAVEVKAPPALWQPSTRLDLGECLHVIENALASAGTVQGQLRADRPGVLVLAGLLMSDDMYETLVTSSDLHLQKVGQNTPHLLGITVFNLRLWASPGPGGASTAMEQRSVLRRNPAYSGRLVIDNDWSGPWRLVRR